MAQTIRRSEILPRSTSVCRRTLCLLVLTIGSVAKPTFAQARDAIAAPVSPPCKAGAGFSINGERFEPGDAAFVRAGFDARGMPVVQIELSDPGRVRFTAAQDGLVGKPLPICLGEKLLSAPLLIKPILKASLQIAGLDGVAAATDLANRIRAELVAKPKPTQGTDPLAIDVAKAVECRLDPEDLSTLLVFLGNDESYAARRHWSAVTGDNALFSSRYRLPKPIRVFGHDTDRIALANQTVFAVLSDVDIRTLAAQLSIKPELDADGTFIGARVMVDAEVKDPDDGEQMRVFTALQLTNLGATPPGETLVGCSYMSRTLR